MKEGLGAQHLGTATRFAVRSPRAEAVWLCRFEGTGETRLPMTRDGAIWTVTVPDAPPGTRYGYRADGPPPFDVSKLLIDPHAIELDRRFAYDPRLAEPGTDTAALVPKAIVPVASPPTKPPPPLFAPGGLIYELNVRGFTMLHPDVPPEQRGTIAALAHHAIIAHLKKLHVAAVELMPVVAWIDERHLPPLGLVNAWGYNPVVPMALDPGLAPGGVMELRDTVAALREAGIGVILDLVFNHTGESDHDGPTLSFRGLDEAIYARGPDGELVNHTGTGNTLDFGNPAVVDLTIATLRHFVGQCGVDGFRFDLAPVLARSPGFDPHAAIFAAIADDPLLADRIMIAEPWDIGPGGYQLGNFPPTWLEWNDRFRDDVRRFWGGDGSAGALATRLAGSSDIFGPDRTRTVNFLAAHDGFTLADLTSYEHRHNHANGEHNRDGHGENLSWNCGIEGATDDPAVRARRNADRRALLTILFASRGTIMLAAGDEFARTQHGNNNAYAQDNPLTWVDWRNRDIALERHVAELADARARHPEIADPAIRHDATWFHIGGAALADRDWDDTDGFELRIGDEPFGIRIDRRARIAALVERAKGS